MIKKQALLFVLFGVSCMIAAEHVPLAFERKLFQGALHGNIEQLREGAEQLTDLSVPTQDGYTALHLAVSSNFVEGLKLLLSFAALEDEVSKIVPLLSKSIQVDAKDSDGETPLHMAVGMGHLEAVRLLLVAGADVDIRNNQDMSALGKAEDSMLADLERMPSNMQKIQELLLRYRKHRPQLKPRTGGKMWRLNRPKCCTIS